MSKRKYIEIDISEKIFNKRKNTEELLKVTKYQKTSGLKKYPKEYLCYKHDNNQNICNLYDCSGCSFDIGENNNIFYIS